MRKTGKLKRNPPVKPVRSIEVPVKVTKKKILLIAVLLALGITLIVFAVVKFLTVPKGWQAIEVPSGLTDTFIYDFSLTYEIGKTDQKPNKEQNAVSEIYVQAAGDAYRIFSEDEIKDVKNIYYINRHPGETVKVAPELYQAFSMLTQQENRVLYLGPVYENHRTLIACQNDLDASEYQPATDEETAEMYRTLVKFLNDPEHIRLELLKDNKVRLHISQEYQDYAKEIGATAFISLDWMRNAFVTDYIADALIEKGYCNGYLASYDGYIRYLNKDGSYDFSVMDGAVNIGYRAGTMNYTGVGALVWLRSYPITTEDKPDYYVWDDGHVTTSRLDPADGGEKSACTDMVVYSRDLNCAQILVQSMPVYVADSMDWQALSKLPANGVEYVAVYNHIVYTSDKTTTLVLNHEYGKPQYTVPGGEE